MAQLNVFRPATLSDLTRLQPVLPMKYWRGLAAQISSFPAFALDRCGVPVLIVCLVPDRGTIEACVIFGRTPPPLSAMRQMLLSAATILPERSILVRIEDGNQAGQHMARLAGYRPTDDVFAGTKRAWIRPAFDASATAPET